MKRVFVVLIFLIFIGVNNSMSQPEYSITREDDTTAPTVFANGSPGQGPPPYDAPLDGGASLLAAAGVAYGAKKIYGLRKKKNQNKDEDLDN